jgi:hypothetical protein
MLSDQPRDVLLVSLACMITDHPFGSAPGGVSFTARLNRRVTGLCSSSSILEIPVRIMAVYTNEVMMLNLSFFRHRDEFYSFL